MGVNRCLTQALLIAKKPRGQWKGGIAQLPEACQAPGICSGGIGCRERLADYLRVQWRMIERREALKTGRGR
ncbi:hypothetical protein E5C33_07500 [Stenotrophomonas maltophilia]|nr:hypothetical protein E5C33_07500 [Stenotrophomonas maltophilia]